MKQSRAGAAWVALSLLLAGCAEYEFYRPNMGPVGERHRPALEAVWAQSEIGYSQLWRIYVRATDPDADLDKVWVTFSRYGGTYPGEFLILPAAQRRQTNGYVQVWVRMRGESGLREPFLPARAQVRVEDRAGNMSDARAFEFTVVNGMAPDKGQPPDGFAREAKLGELRFTIERLGAGNGDRSQ